MFFILFFFCNIDSLLPQSLERQPAEWLGSGGLDPNSNSPISLQVTFGK